MSIRTTTDRGVVAVLDARLVEKGYGGYLRGALPPIEVVRDVGSVRDFLQGARAA